MVLRLVRAWGVQSAACFDPGPSLGLDLHGEVLDVVLDQLLHPTGERDEPIVLVTAGPKAVDHSYGQFGDGPGESVIHVRRSLAPMPVWAGDERQPTVVDGLARNCGHLLVAARMGHLEISSRGAWALLRS